MAKNILIVHCSPRKKGNSARMAERFAEGARDAGNEVTMIEVGRAHIAGCLGCEYCFKHEGVCVQDDEMQRYYPLLRDADVLVYATPMYNYNFPAQMRAFQDRMFCGIAKPFDIPFVGLLMCFEDKDMQRARPIVDAYKVCCEYCKQQSIGEILVNNVWEAGAIEGNEGLDRCYELGKSIS